MRETTHMKKWIRDNWDGWIESYEPRLGSSVGIPDIQIVVDGKLVPIELKVADLSDGILCSSEIRPPQINWHRNLAAHDVLSLFLFGVGKGNVPERLFAARGDKIANWSAGFDIRNLEEVSPNKRNFSGSLRELIRYMLSTIETKSK